MASHETRGGVVGVSRPQPHFGSYPQKFEKDACMLGVLGVLADADEAKHGTGEVRIFHFNTKKFTEWTWFDSQFVELCTSTALKQ